VLISGDGLRIARLAPWTRPRIAALPLSRPHPFTAQRDQTRVRLWSGELAPTYPPPAPTLAPNPTYPSALSSTKFAARKVMSRSSERLIFCGRERRLARLWRTRSSREVDDSRHQFVMKVFERFAEAHRKERLRMPGSHAMTGGNTVIS